jgi:cytochrome c553
MISRSSVALLLAIAPFAAGASPLMLGDAAQGKALHAQSCGGCHGTEVYTRPDRRIRSAEGLLKQVELCNSNLDKGFSDKQLNDLVKYLNDSFYKFK